MYIRLLKRVTLASAQAILLVYYIMQTAVLYKEAYLQLLEIELNLIIQTFAARTTQLDPKHLLRVYVTTILQTKQRNIRLARLILVLLKAEAVVLIASPPQLVYKICKETSKRVYRLQGRTKERAAEDFTKFLATVPIRDI